MSATDRPSSRPDLSSRWHSVLDALAAALPPSRALDVLLEQGRRLLTADAGVIALLGPEPGLLTLERTSGRMSHTAGSIVVIDDAEPIARAVLTDAPQMLSTDIDTDTAIVRVFPPMGHESFVILPFIAGQQRGALGFSAVRAGAFRDADDLEVARVLAATCAQLIIGERNAAQGAAGPIALTWRDEVGAVVQAANGFDWEWDLETGSVTRSREVEHVTGYTMVEMSPTWRSWGSLIHPSHAAPTGHQDAAAIIREMTGDGFSNEYRIRRKDGAIIWVLERGLIVRDDQGRPIRVIGHTSDIQERKTAELALRTGEARYRGLIELSPDAILIHQDGIYTFANPAAVRLFGAENVGQILGKSPFDLIHPAWHPAVRERLELLAAGRRVPPLEEKILRLDGTVVDVEASATPYDTGDGWAVLLIMRDVSERSAHEAALSESERRYRTMFENAAVGIALFDPEGGFINVNDRLAEMVGYTPRALLTMDWQALGHPDETPLQIELRERIASGDTDDVALERRILRADGSTVWVALTARAVQDRDGALLYTIAFLQDITARRQAEEQLRSGEARYRNLLESIDQGFCVFEMLYDADGQAVDYRFLEVNPTFEQHTGLTNPVGQTARSMVPDLEMVWVERYARVAETGEMERFEMGSLAMGRLFDVEAARVGQPHERKVALIFRDITERRRAETVTRESEEKYRSLFTSIDEGYVLLEILHDDHGNPVDALYLEANPAAERTLGGPLVGRRALDLHPDVERSWFETYDRVARTGVSERREQYDRSVDAWFDFFAFKIGAEADRRVAVVYQDVTARKRREANAALLAEITNDLARHTSIVDITRAVGRTLERHLDVPFCEYVALNAAEDTITFLGYWNGPDVSGIPEPLHISEAALADQVAEANAGEAMVAHDLSDSPLTYTDGDRLITARAFIGIPLHRVGDLRFIFGIHDSRPRTWRDDEIELVGEVGRRVSARQERIVAEEQLRRAAELDAYRVRLSDALRPLTDAGQLMATSARILGLHLRTDLVRFFDIAPDGEHLVTAHDAFESPAATDLPRRFRLRDLDPFLLMEFDAERPVAIADAAARLGLTPLEREDVAPGQIGAFIAHPLVREGRLAALLCLVQSEPRAWTADEMAVVRETAERTWAAIDRVHAEEALRASDQHLGALVNQTISAIIETDLTGKYLFVNERYCELTGYTRDELVGKMRMHDITHPDDLQLTVDSLRRLVDEGVPFAIQKRYIRPDGSIVWIDKSVSAITDRDGKRRSIVAVMVDMTEHKRAEADLLQREARSRFLAELHEQLDRVVDPEAVRATASRALAGFLGVHAVDVIDIQQPLSKEARSLNALGGGQLRAHLSLGRTVAIADVRVDPLTASHARSYEELSIRSGVAAPLMREGRWGGALMVAHDAPRRWDDEDLELIRTVAERTWLAYENARLLRDLSEREERLQMVGAATQDAIFDWDIRAERVWHNHSFTTQFGASESGVASSDLKFWSLRLHPADRELALRLLSQAIEDGASGCTLEYRIRRVNGDYAYVLERTLIARDAHGQAVRVVGALTDLTERHQWEVALRESEERFRSMAQTTNRGVWLLDRDGVTQFANTYLGDLLGYTPDELIGRSLNDFCFPEDGEAVRARINANLRGESHEFDFRLRRKDGTAVAVLAGTTPVRDARGIVGVLGAFTDITARKRAADQTWFLAESTRALTESLDVARTLQEVARLAVPVIADWCTLNLAEPDGSIRLAAAVHRDPEVEPLLWDLAREHPLAPDATDGTPAVIRSGEPELTRFAPPAGEDPEALAGLTTHGPGTLLIVPLRTAHRTFGALSLARLDPGRGFDQEDVALVVEVARRAALAIENAAYFHDEQVARARAEADRERITRLQTVTALLSQTLTQEQVFEVAVRASMASLGATAGAIFVVSDNGAAIDMAHARGYSAKSTEGPVRLVGPATSPVARVIATGNAVWAEAPDALADSVGLARAIVPLVLADRVIGAIELSFAGAVVFEIEDRDLLLALAAQCAQALERARLLEAERHARAAADAAARASTFLADASKLLARSLDEQETFEATVQAAVTGLADFAIVWAQVDHELLVKAWAHGDPTTATDLERIEQSYRASLTDPFSPLGRVLRDGQSVLQQLPGTASDPGMEPAAKSHVFVPLLGRRGTHGVLALVRSNPDSPFAGDDLALAEELARRAALAAENARLYLEAQTWNATLEERVAERTEALRHSQEELRQLAAYQHRVREFERRHIAQEIHDEMGGTLTGMKMMVAGLRRRHNESLNAEELQELSNLIDDTVQTVRRIASELRPAILDSLGLLPALEWQAREFQKRTGIACNVNVAVDDLIVDEETSIAVFRVFQESLTNVARHAQASEVVAVVERDGDFVVLRVIDNGQGLQAGAIQPGKSLGLLGMRERIEHVSGEFDIVSTPGAGTSVVIRIPLKQPSPRDRVVGSA